MKPYIIGSLWIAILGFLAFLDTRHILDAIKHQPMCFPPYIQMSLNVSQGLHCPHRPLSLTIDEGLRPLVAFKASNLVYYLGVPL